MALKLSARNALSVKLALAPTLGEEKNHLKNGDVAAAAPAANNNNNHNNQQNHNNHNHIRHSASVSAIRSLRSAKRGASGSRHCRGSPGARPLDEMRGHARGGGGLAASRPCARRQRVHAEGLRPRAACQQKAHGWKPMAGSPWLGGRRPWVSGAAMPWARSGAERKPA